MKNNLKIAIYSGEIPSTTFVERLIEGLAHHGNQVLLFGKIKKKVDYENTKIKVVGFIDSPFWKLFFLFKYTFLLYFFRRKEKKRLDNLILKDGKNRSMYKVKYYPVLWHKPDIFHLQWAKGISEWMWVQDFGMKLILSLRGAHINYSPLTVEGLNQTYNECFPKVDGFHAVSKAIALEASKYGSSLEKTKVIYSGFSLKDDISTAISFTENKKTQVLSVGRSHWKKGYNYALDACSILKTKGFDFHYTIIGAQGVEELEYQRGDLGLTDCVTFLGSVSYAEVLRFMQETHIVLLPSVEEGIANVVLEAMMLKKVVISTNCGGMEEIIVDGINGFVVPLRDSEEIAKKIISVYSNEEWEIKKIANNARLTIEEINSEKKMIQDMINLYKSS